MSGQCPECNKFVCNNEKHSDPVTPSQQAKSVGLKSLTQVNNITGVSLNTLTNWQRNKPELFRIVLMGCLQEVKGNTI